jgi:hypothetical protein
MADSHDLIQTTTLTATSASISFTSIPQTYDTLKIVIHARATAGGVTPGINMAWNGATGLTSGRYLFWNLNSGGDLNEGSAGLELHAAWFPGSSVAANYFGSSEVYITNYSASTSKIYMCDNWHGTENGFSTNQAYLGLFSVVTTGATSISNITFYPGTNFAIGTTISMYGIKGA